MRPLMYNCMLAPQKIENELSKWTASPSADSARHAVFSNGITGTSTIVNAVVE